MLNKLWNWRGWDALDASRRAGQKLSHRCGIGAVGTMTDEKESNALIRWPYPIWGCDAMPAVGFRRSCPTRTCTVSLKWSGRRHRAIRFRDCRARILRDKWQDGQPPQAVFAPVDGRRQLPLCARVRPLFGGNCPSAYVYTIRPSAVKMLKTRRIGGFSGVSSWWAPDRSRSRPSGRAGIYL